jgi:hypothetical protein
MPALAKSGCRYVKVTEADGDKPASYALTGYGRNVVNTAVGLLEFGLHLDGMAALDDDGKLDEDACVVPESYRDVERIVKAYRQAKRDAENPDAVLQREALAKADEAYRELRKLIADQKDHGVTEQLTAALGEILSDVESQLQQQNELDDEAAIAA